MTDFSAQMNWYAQPSQAGFFAASIHRFYQEANLNPTKIEGGRGIPVMPMVAQQTVNFGMVGPDQIMQARSADSPLPLVGVYATFQTYPQCLMYHASKPVQEFKDLSGRTVIVTVDSAFWKFLEAKYKITDIKQQNMSDAQMQMWAADENAVTQCYVSSEPATAARMGISAGTLFVASSGYNPYGNMIATTEDMIRNHPEVVQAFVTASLRGWKQYLDDAKETNDWIATVGNTDKYSGVDARGVSKRQWLDEEAALEKTHLLGTTNHSDYSNLGMIDLVRIEALHKQLRDPAIGTLAKDVDFKAAFDDRFIKAAHKEVFGK
jgi:ABC-type nitrate/sulfonate/bicarbonate transport system substrate-binding protein